MRPPRIPGEMITTEEEAKRVMLKAGCTNLSEIPEMVLLTRIMLDRLAARFARRIAKQLVAKLLDESSKPA